MLAMIKFKIWQKNWNLEKLFASVNLTYFSMLTDFSDNIGGNISVFLVV